MLLVLTEERTDISYLVFSSLLFDRVIYSRPKLAKPIHRGETPITYACGDLSRAPILQNIMNLMLKMIFPFQVTGVICPNVLTFSIISLHLHFQWSGAPENATCTYSIKLACRRHGMVGPMKVLWKFWSLIPRLWINQYRGPYIQISFHTSRNPDFEVRSGIFSLTLFLFPQRHILRLHIIPPCSQTNLKASTENLHTSQHGNPNIHPKDMESGISLRHSTVLSSSIISMYVILWRKLEFWKRCSRLRSLHRFHFHPKRANLMLHDMEFEDGNNHSDTSPTRWQGICSLVTNT